MKIEFKPVISRVEAGPEEWQLCHGDCPDFEGDGPMHCADCEAVASQLNHAFKDAVNAGNDRDKVIEIMHQHQMKFSDFGAADTEGNDMVWSMCQSVFGAI